MASFLYVITTHECWNLASCARADDQLRDGELGCGNLKLKLASVPASTSVIAPELICVSDISLKKDC